tara:strand:- start:580 stop:891 length:312 start_codon:yes stop_codon:yes gene_type:complete
MTFLEILIGCVLVLFALCLVITWKLIKFSLLILEVEEAINDCVELLDEKYRSMSEVLETPVFFDSVEVRKVISDIQDCQKAVVVVANRLTGDIGLKGEITKEN